jgi:hypothetical protein
VITGCDRGIRAKAGCVTGLVWGSGHPQPLCLQCFRLARPISWCPRAPLSILLGLVSESILLHLHLNLPLMLWRRQMALNPPPLIGDSWLRLLHTYFRLSLRVVHLVLRLREPWCLLRPAVVLGSPASGRETRT